MPLLCCILFPFIAYRSQSLSIFYVCVLLAFNIRIFGVVANNKGWTMLLMVWVVSIEKRLEKKNTIAMNICKWLAQHQLSKNNCLLSKIQLNNIPFFRIQKRKTLHTSIGTDSYPTRLKFEDKYSYKEWKLACNSSRESI